MNSSRELSLGLIETGFAIAPTDDQAVRSLTELIEQARTYFRRSLEQKCLNSSRDSNFGYRPYGQEYSQDPARPDSMESFTVWSDRIDLVPAVSDIPSLAASVLRWRVLVSRLAASILHDVAQHFGAPSPPVSAASQLQVNRYLEEDYRHEYLQEQHEDGDLFTVLHATSPGLEICRGEVAESIVMRPNSLAVMAGSTLSALTCGRVGPLYHQVRNVGCPDRISVVYFVNPELGRPLYAWSASPQDRRDLRPSIQSAPTAFGLPHVPRL